MVSPVAGCDRFCVATSLHQEVFDGEVGPPSPCAAEGWQLAGQARGAGRVAGVYSTQAEATEAANRPAPLGGELMVQGRDGRIRGSERSAAIRWPRSLRSRIHLSQESKRTLEKFDRTELRVKSAGARLPAGSGRSLTTDFYDVEADGYCYIGTTVLKNKLGLRDQAELNAFEALSVAVRLRSRFPPAASPPRTIVLCTAPLPGCLQLGRALSNRSDDKDRALLFPETSPAKCAGCRPIASAISEGRAPKDFVEEAAAFWPI